MTMKVWNHLQNTKKKTYKRGKFLHEHDVSKIYTYFITIRNEKSTFRVIKLF